MKSPRQLVATGSLVSLARHAGTLALMICCLPFAAGAEDPPTEALQQEETAFRSRLESLAERCESLGLDEQARITRGWVVPRDPRRLYLFSVPDDASAEAAEAAATLVRQWHGKFMEYRRAHAESLWQLVSRFLEAGQPAAAYRLIHEVLHHDPDHAEARRVLGFRRVGTRWQAAVERSRVQAGRTNHPEFGWRRGQYWRVESPHFRVTTALSPQAGTELVERLEELHSVWRQVFFRIWSSADALRELLAGGKPEPRPKARHEVVLFRDRDEYVAQLKSVEPQIEMTLGYYLKGRRTAFFYGAGASGDATQLHEVSHQLFQERGGAVPDPGERANFWIVEGIALYMESLVRHAGYHTVGGFDADRLQFARARRLGGEFHLPLAELVRLGREDLQRHPDLRRIYSEAAGLTQMLMDDEGGRLREATIDYVNLVNRGLDTSSSLAEVSGRTLDEIEARYPEFLAVRDDDLQFVQCVSPLRNLSLGRTEVTDRGLAHLRAPRWGS